MLLVLVFLKFSMGLEAAAITTQRCPTNWYHDEPGRSCYHLAPHRMRLAEAHTYCASQAENSHVLRIECGGETDFIFHDVMKGESDQRIWIDARARFDILDGSAGLFGPGFVYRWPNGKIVRYSNWAEGHGMQKVNRKLDKCVQAKANGQWVNSNCTSLAKVICEKKLHRPYSKFCPKHWIYFSSTQSCYRTISKANMTALEADSKCYDYGAEHRQDAMLSSVMSEQENEFILELALKKNSHLDFIFLGGFGKSNNGHKWHWMDGSPFKYLNWDRGSPYGARAFAVLVMNRRGKWLNHYADRILSQYNSVAVCKFKS
ncbi:unnamed protein product [Caenorhabditis angaria]|uniref:C-type lectin domain-containing protein n=1 Tax=Caenorhabditis angaria TaxID=860376 RepID=A0A9P1MTV6_9PELO|nr:unnamed protein product [Caenorhabditis angaria]